MRTKTARSVIVAALLALHAPQALAGEAPQAPTVEAPSEALIPELPAPQIDPLARTLEDYNRDRRRDGIISMSVLLGWSVANIGVGAVGWAVADDPEWQAFHQMSIGWNVINMSLAIPGLVGGLRTKPGEFNLGQSLKEGNGARISFAFNTGLDVGWIFTGVWFLERGIRTDNAQFKGFGRSMILQGGFLLLFDLAMWITRDVKDKRFVATPVVGDILGVQAVGRF